MAYAPAFANDGGFSFRTDQIRDVKTQMLFGSPSSAGTSNDSSARTAMIRIAA